MNSETKLFSGIIAVTAVIIIGAAFAFSRPANILPVDPKILIKEDSYKTSSASAIVTLVNFGDFQCPACGAYHTVVKQLEAKYKDSMAVIFRHFPLSMHPNAVPAAMAAEAAGKQGKFWEMHDKLYETQAEWSDEKKTEDIFSTYAKDIQLDVEQFKKDLSNADLQNRINRDVTDANTLHINATPTFYVNNIKIKNPASLADFEEVIKSAIEKAATTSASK